MNIHAGKGRSLSEQDALDLGRILLKIGYHVLAKREKQGSTYRWSVELYEEVPFGHKNAAPDATNIESGAAQSQSITPSL